MKNNNFQNLTKHFFPFLKILAITTIIRKFSSTKIFLYLVPFIYQVHKLEKRCLILDPLLDAKLDFFFNFKLWDS